MNEYKVSIQSRLYISPGSGTTIKKKSEKVKKKKYMYMLTVQQSKQANKSNRAEAGSQSKTQVADSNSWKAYI